ncbi:MAG TPA: YciI family protein [Thermoanaerobaculia bacterium]|nr:YciI family protein [Thermoanaerobaculia bacterium]
MTKLTVSLAFLLFSACALTVPAGALAQAPQLPQAPPAAEQKESAGAAGAQTGQAGKEDATPSMTTYYMALLRRGAKWTPEVTPEIERIGEGHMANIRRLAAEGKLLLAGPFLQQSGPGSLAGIFVLRAGSLDEARKLVDTDPAIRAGRFVAEIVPWLGPKTLECVTAPPR